MLALRNGTELIQVPQLDAVDHSRHGAGPRPAGGETLLGIDVRPADGEVYGVGSTSRLYRINAITGAAIVVGPLVSTPLSGTQFGVDFDPATDRLRIVSDDEQNLSVDADSGVATAQAPLNDLFGSISSVGPPSNVDGASSRRCSSSIRGRPAGRADLAG